MFDSILRMLLGLDDQMIIGVTTVSVIFLMTLGGVPNLSRRRIAS